MKKRIAAGLLLLAMLFGAVAPFTAFQKTAWAESEAPKPDKVQGASGGVLSIFYVDGEAYSKTLKEIEVKRGGKKVSFTKVNSPYNIPENSFFVEYNPYGQQYKLKIKLVWDPKWGSEYYYFKAGDEVTIISTGYPAKTFRLVDKNDSGIFDFTEVQPPAPPVELDFDIDTESLTEATLKGAFGETLSETEITLTGGDAGKARFTKAYIVRGSDEQVEASELGLSIQKTDDKVTITGTPNAEATEDNLRIYIEAKPKDSSQKPVEKFKYIMIRINPKVEIKILTEKVLKGATNDLQVEIKKNDTVFTEMPPVFSLVGNYQPETKIQKGKLIVAADESAKEITVSAAYGGKEAVKKLLVEGNSDRYEITEITPIAMIKGQTAELNVKVTKNGAEFAASNYKTEWTITSGGHDVGTKIEGNRLTVADGEPKDEITVKAVCKTGDTPIADQEHTIALTQAAPPQTYVVNLTPGIGYTLTAQAGSNSPVAEGGSFSFKVTIASGYHKGTDFKVKVGAVALTEDTPGTGIYTIKNIREGKIVTVEGVVADAQVPAEEVTAAKAKLQTYVNSVKSEVLNLPGIKTEGNKAAIEEFKTHLQKANELLGKANNEITAEELQTMKGMPGKKGTFYTIVKKMRADFEVLGQRLEKNKDNGKLYPILEQGKKIRVKSQIADLTNAEGAEKRLYLNYISKTNYNAKNKADAVGGATPKYDKTEVPVTDYAVTKEADGYTITVNKIPEGAVILKPVIKVKLAEDTKIENGDLIYVKKSSAPTPHIPHTPFTPYTPFTPNTPSAPAVPNPDTFTRLESTEQGKTYTAEGTAEALNGAVKLDIVMDGQGKTHINFLDRNGNKIQTKGAVKLTIPLKEGMTPPYRVKVEGRYTTFAEENGQISFVIRPTAQVETLRLTAPAEGQNISVEGTPHALNGAKEIKTERKENGKLNIRLYNEKGEEIKSRGYVFIQIPIPKNTKAPYRVKVDGKQTTFEETDKGSIIFASLL